MITAEHLVELERKYSEGKVTLNLPMWQKSPNDTHPIPRHVFDGHRMRSDGDPRAHGYAKGYAEGLKDVDVRVIVELGILRGIGLAMWCEAFPNARVIGLDWDLTSYKGNLAALEARGAFAKNKPEVYRFDETTDYVRNELGALLEGDSIDVFIDDAIHYPDINCAVFDAVSPHMSGGGVYFIEDTKGLAPVMRKKFPNVPLKQDGLLVTVKF